MKAKKILATLIAASACLSMAAMSVSAESTPKNELIDGTKFNVDGDLSEWTEQKLAGMTLQGTGDYAKKSVTFYGAMTTTGLYLACDVYHDVYINDENGINFENNYFENTYLDLCIGSVEQHFTIYADKGAEDGFTVGKNTASTTVTIDNAFMKNAETGDANKAKYHTTVEIFVATAHLPANANTSKFPNTFSVGMGWRTPRDVINGSQYAGQDGLSDAWGIKGYDGPTCPMVATPQGLFGADKYTVPADPGPGNNGGNNGGTGDPGKEPENPPATGTASIVIAAVATVSLAGVIVAARKRKQD